MKNGTITGRICFALSAGVHPLVVAAADTNGLSVEAAQLLAIFATGLVAWFASAHWLDTAFAEAIGGLAKFLYGGTFLALMCAIAYAGEDRGTLLLTVGALGVGAWLGASRDTERDVTCAAGDLVAAFIAITAQLSFLWIMKDARIDPLALVQCTMLALLVAAFAAIRFGWPSIASTSAIPT